MLFDAKRLALTEFNTWYIRGLAKKLIDEGIKECQVYRLTPKITNEQKNECEECNKIENTVVSVKEVYAGHRARYHPYRNPSAFSIPLHWNCCHSIRRIR